MIDLKFVYNELYGNDTTLKSINRGVDHSDTKYAGILRKLPPQWSISRTERHKLRQDHPKMYYEEKLGTGKAHFKDKKNSKKLEMLQLRKMHYFRHVSKPSFMFVLLVTTRTV